MQPTDSPQQFCLRWHNHQANLTLVFDQLLQSESFVDVTLACEGHSIKAHKVVLSACSPYFKQLFIDNPCQHPIIILKDIDYHDLKAMVEFMYKGEISVGQDQIGPLLKVAESLKIRGLADVKSEEEPNRPRKSPPPRSYSPLGLNKKRRRKCSPERKSFSSPEVSPGGDVSLEALPLDRSPSHEPAVANMNLSHSLPSVPSAEPANLPCPMPSSAPPPTSAVDDMEIKPGIAEMIREEERAKLLENSHGWLGASTSTLAADSYQYQLQSMWQKCWNTNQSLVHNLRFRERGPLKSWRPETMAEAIFSVLKEGLSLSQAARKYDIPYPTFVLYANRVHNMLGPSADGAADLRPKGRGRPQRILLGVWPDEHIRGVIRAVVFRDPQHIKEDAAINYPKYAQDAAAAYLGGACVNNNTLPAGSVGGNAADANSAAIAAVAHGLRQQMCNMVAAAHHPLAPPTAEGLNAVGSGLNLNLLSHCNALGLPHAPPNTNGMRLSPHDLRINSPVTRDLDLSPQSSPCNPLDSCAVNLSTSNKESPNRVDVTKSPHSDNYEINLSTRHLPAASKSPASDAYDDFENFVSPPAPSEGFVRDTPMPLKVEITE